MIAKFVGVARGKAFAVDLHESFGRQSAIGTIALETAIPLDDGVFVETSGIAQEIQVMFAQSVFGFLLTHDFNTINERAERTTKTCNSWPTLPND